MMVKQLPPRFLLVANNPALNSAPDWPLANWTRIRFNDCKATWPAHSAQLDVLAVRWNSHCYWGAEDCGAAVRRPSPLLRRAPPRDREAREMAPAAAHDAATGTPGRPLPGSASPTRPARAEPQGHGRSPLGQRSFACDARLRTSHFASHPSHVLHIGGPHEDLRIVRYSHQRRNHTLSSGMTMIRHLRRIFPSSTIVCAGFTFHEDEGSRSRVHNYTYEERLASREKGLVVLKTADDVRGFISKMKRGGL